MLIARLAFLMVCSVTIAVAQSQPNQDYLSARQVEASGNVAQAAAGYEAVVTRNSILKEYALWRLARIARATGDLVLERERIQRLITSAPNSLLYETAALRLSESFFESGDFTAAANSAKALTAVKNVSIAREAAALMGVSLLRAGKTAEARDAFTKLLMQMPDASRPDDFALIAVRELDALDKSAGTTNLTEAEHLLRASVYQFNRDFAGARVHYQTLIDRYPQSGTLPNAILQLGRGYYLELKYDDAIKAFQKVFDAHPQSQAAREAVGWLGSTYLRTKRTDDAVAAYKLLIDRFPDSPTPDRPYLNIIDALHEAGRHADALNWVQQTRARFRNDLGGTLALFAQLRIHLAQASWAAAVRDAEELAKISDLGGTRVPGGTNAAEVAFLRAFALEQLGRTEEAVAGYLAIPDGRNEYYGACATQRLQSFANDPKARTLVQMRFNALSNEAKVASAAGQWEQARAAAQSALRLTNDPQKRSELLALLRTAYDSLPTYRLPKFNQISLTPASGSNPVSATPASGSNPNSNNETPADALLTLGLYDEALPELLATKKTNATPDESYTLARLSLQAGFPNRAVRFAENVWRSVPADYVIDLAPREMIELLYPAPFRESLLKHATTRNVDPRFVLSIARQESRFQAEAKSVAAARGMMQFIPSTANEMAAELKLAKFEQDDLYNADTAILFGSHYLANLFKQFPDQPQAVAGSYNGGADNLARWIARSRSTEPDRYVPEIGFSQTKDYVYKVMANFWTYQKLYDAQLQTAGPAK